MKVEVPCSEVADRISILLLKLEHFADRRQRTRVRERLEALRSAWQAEGLPDLEALPQWDDLCAVNAALWEVEDALRAHEAADRFDGEFVERARSVYRLNDRRAALKRAIDEVVGSRLVEEKGYRDA